MKKITLINPPQFSGYPQPPLGLISIASVLEREGYQVSLLDANAMNLQVRDVVSRITDTDIVGITAMTPTISNATAIVRYIRQKHPDLPIVLGGAHATLLPEKTLVAAPEIDFIVRGEGEETIVELLRAIADKRAIAEVPGISYMDDGQYLSTPDRKADVMLDSLPFPAYHLLSGYKYRPHPPHGLTMPFMAMVTSRGCPHRCAYCSKPIFGSRFRAQSPERVVEEISSLKDRFGIKEIAIYDDVFTLDKNRVHDIADAMIDKGIKINWTCETRVNLVDRKLLEHMKQAGCYAVAYGIESASPEILETLHKDISPEQVKEAVRTTREVGLQAIGYFMIGSPGETRETIVRTIDMAKKLKLDFAQFSITTPFPATELYDLYMQDKHEDIPWENFVYTGTDGDKAPIFESDRLSRADIRRWVSRAYRDFYLRPAYLWQRLCRITSIAEFKMNLKGFLMLLRSIIGS